MGQYLRYLKVPIGFCLIGLTLVAVVRGWQAVWITGVLLALEISLSFDNAVVNARVLDRLTPGQQQFFLTWGLVIPVFGVRFLGPLLLVCLAGGVSLATAFDDAFNHPEAYHDLLKLAEPRILAFGGMFLLMVCLRYFFNEAKSLHWMRAIESRLSRAGRIESLEVALALWGLLPEWVKDPASAHRCLHARAETVALKPSFRGAWRHRRCLIPADAFWEKGRWIRRRDRELFWLAGLWDRWIGPDGSELETCCVLTTAPNALLAPIHRRMPALIPAGLEAAWLEPADGHLLRALEPLLLPWDPADWQVDGQPVALDQPQLKLDF